MPRQWCCESSFGADDTSERQCCSGDIRSAECMLLHLHVTSALNNCLSLLKNQFVLHISYYAFSTMIGLKFQSCLTDPRWNFSSGLNSALSPELNQFSIFWLLTLYNIRITFACKLMTIITMYMGNNHNTLNISKYDTCYNFKSAEKSNTTFHTLTDFNLGKQSEIHEHTCNPPDW